MKINHFLFIISFLFISCQGQTEKKPKVLTAQSFAEKIKTSPNTILLDVRTPEEFAEEHLDNAINIDWKNTNEFETEVIKLDKNKPVLIYCLSGGRSKKAAEKLTEMGFESVYELEGGIMKWNAEGFGKPSNKVIGMSKSEYQKLLSGNKKVLVDFYAEWCPPCKKMAPYLTQMQNDSTSSVTIIRIDVDKNKTLAEQLNITQLPTLILYNSNKEEQWRNFGFISEADLKKQL